MAEGRVKFNYVFQPCNDTFQFGVIVSASYDEYTALVKCGNVASKHVNGWRGDRNVRFEIVV